MFEYEMFNINTFETEFAYGYSLTYVREKYPKYQKTEWVCLTSTYID